MDADVTFEDIVFSFGTTLSAGEFTSEGLDFTTGSSRPIPVEFWRTPNAHAALIERRLHAVAFEKSEPAVSIIPLIEYAAVKKRFDHKNGEVSVLDENLFEFDEGRWDLSTPADLAASTTLNDEALSTFPIEQVGRKPKHNWDAFWVEAVLYADLNSLTIDNELHAFRKHMHDFVTKAVSGI